MQKGKRRLRRRFKLAAIYSGIAAVDQGRSFVSTTGPRTTTAGDMRFALIRAGSAKQMRVRKIICSSDATLRFRFACNPTVTDYGTEQGYQNRRLGDAGTAEGRLYYNPTISAEGTAVYDQWVNPNAPFVLDFAESPWILTPNQTVLVTVASGGGQNASLSIEWDEL
jgi:hypothetical protein